MNEIREKINIEDMIHEIRGKQVILDSDLAKLYMTTTSNLNKSRKRNLIRFPEDFCFQLTKEEYYNLKFQNGISKIDGRTINRNLPHVYTEEGVAMLSSLLKTDIAEKVSIKIMRAFVQMRNFINNNISTFKELNEIRILTIKNTNDIQLLQECFNKLDKSEKSNHLFFDGQIYDAYSLLVDILKEAKEEIIIIDNYIDKSILDIISLLDKNVTIITNKYNNVDIEKYKRQYNNLNIVISNSFHDRFIILDRKELYHCGASFKDLGNKCFSINKIDDSQILNQLLKKIM